MKKDITNLFCFIDDFSSECKEEINKERSQKLQA